MRPPRYGRRAMKTRGERLRAARKNRFKSARTAALAMGIAVSTYGAHERAESPGGRDYGPEEATRYARRFGVTPEWLLTGLRQAQTDMPFAPERFEPPRTTKLIVMGYVGAGSQGHFYSDSQGPLEEIDMPRVPSAGIQIVEIREHGLGPAFNRWRVFLDDPRDPVTPDLLDRLCVVSLPDGSLALGMLQPGKTHGRYDVISEFGTSHWDVAVRWAAKVTIMLPP